MKDYSEHLADIGRELDRLTATAAAGEYRTAALLAHSIERRMAECKVSLGLLQLERDAWPRKLAIDPTTGAITLSSTDANAKLVTS